MTAPTSSKMIERIRLHYEAGVAPNDCALAIGCGKTTARKYYTQFGYKPAGNNALMAAIKGCYEAGIPTGECAKVVGCGDTTVRKYYRKFGRPPSTPDRYTSRVIVPQHITKAGKPLNNPARFYQSAFEPA